MGYFGNKKIKKLIEMQMKIAGEGLQNPRRIFISGDINDTNSYAIIMQIMRLYNQDSKKPITIFIDSAGGSVSSGLAVYDVIKTLLCDVTTVCVGEADGIGAVILSSGTPGKRFAIKSSTINIGEFYYSKTKDKSIKKSINDVMSKVYGIIEQNSNLSSRQAKSKGKKILSALDAKKIGIIDEELLDDVVNPFINAV